MIAETKSMADQIKKTGQNREYTSVQEEGKNIAEQGIKYMNFVQYCAVILENAAMDAFENV